MSKSIQLKTSTNEPVYPHPYYPIGSIFLSVVDTNPSQWFGGTWQLIAQGMTLVGVDPNDSDFNAPEKTGGEKTHKLTNAEMPIHDHGGLEWDVSPFGLAPGGGNQQFPRILTVDGGTFQSWNPHTGKAGGDQAHNNMPPFFTCYIWCRTA